VRKLVFKRIACQNACDTLTVDDDMIQLEKLLYPRRSRMMSPPSLQIYLQSRVTLAFKLLTTKLTVSCPCHIDHLCQLTSKAVQGTNGQRENIMTPPVSLSWWTYIKRTKTAVNRGCTISHRERSKFTVLHTLSVC